MAIEAKKRTFLIAGSCIISLLFIGFAYVSSGPNPLTARTADAESTHELLAAYAQKDSDSDGLPDWQEALYETDPNNAHSVSGALTDAQAVANGLVKPRFESEATALDTKTIPGISASPSTLTDQFARKLFGQYLLTRGQNIPSASDIATFVEQGVAELRNDHATPDTFNVGQVKVMGSGPDALLSYQATVEPVLLRVDAGKDRDEVQSFSDAITKGDEKALANVRKYAEDYKTAAHALMKISVPKELAVSHLKLANSLMHVSESLSDMASVSSDPIRTMLGLSLYTPYTESGLQALSEMNSAFLAEHAIPEAGATGSTFYTLTAVAAKK